MIYHEFCFFAIHSVGRKIFTKRVGIEDDSNYGVGDAEDIIDLYKFKEGSEEERMAVLNAARGSGLSFLFEIPPPGKEEIDFDLVDIEKVLIGNAFYVQVNLGNRGGNVRTIQLFININSVYYTGILARKIKQERQIVVLQPYQSKSSIQYLQYHIKLLYLYFIFMFFNCMFCLFFHLLNVLNLKILVLIHNSLNLIIIIIIISLLSLLLLFHLYYYYYFHTKSLIETFQH